MAEARMAVHPMPGLQRAGFEVDTSVKMVQANFSRAGLVIYIPHPRFWLRGFKRWAWRAVNKTQVAFMPLNIYTVFGITGAVAGAVLKSEGKSWVRSGWLANALWYVDSRNPISRQLPTAVRVGYLAAGTAIFGTYLIASAQRFLLRRLLAYQGWLDRANVNTLKNRVWGMTMRFVYLRRISDQLYAYQHCLPKLPLPSARDTVVKYLETVKPLLTPEEYREHAADAETFLAKEAFSIQWRLRFKWLFSNNYVSGWWLDFVYLRSRDSLPINSNWYGIGFAEYRPTTDQAARAAAVTHAYVRTKRELDRGIFDPQIIAGVAPLCMAQYVYAFSTTRVPGHEQDVLEQYDAFESRHIVVIHKGRMYKLPVFSPNTMQQLTALQLYQAFQGILSAGRMDLEENPSHHLAALTTMGRTEWAKVRDEFFITDAHNAARLDVIESAMFVLSLDDASPEDWTSEGKLYMCGNGANRWADKSFNVIITSNALAGVHAEHSWGDAPALAHIMETVLLSELKRENYNADGSIKETDADRAKRADPMSGGKLTTYVAERIDFRVSPELDQIATAAHLEALEKAANFDLCVQGFYDFGKKAIGRTAKVSPDAFIQLALQLAYYRDQGHFDLTYESSMTRLFREGRTETIRSLSEASCQAVRAIEEGTADKAELLKLIRESCEHHQRYTMDCMRGAGVDRHLFCMYVVSVGINKPSGFLKSALGRKWALSTSQIPTQQCSDRHYESVGGKPMFCPNGGFGPVADNGYGVCYGVWDDRVYFNVSATVKAPNTDAKRFFGRVRQALTDLMAIAVAAQPPAKKPSKE